MTTTAQGTPSRGHQIEGELLNAVPGPGFIKTEKVPVNSIIAGSAPVAAVATGTVGVAAIDLGSTDLVGLRFDDTVDASDIAKLQLWLGDDFNEEADQVEFRCLVARRGSTANTDLELQGRAFKFGPEDTDGVAVVNAIPVTVDLGTANAALEYANFSELVIGLSGAGLKKGTLVEVQLRANEAPGSNNFIECFGFEFRYNAHAGPVKSTDDHWTTSRNLAMVPAQS